MIESIIFDKLPDRVSIHDVEYRINYGYRAIMAIEIEMFGDNNDEQKLLNALNIFYFQDIPSDWDEAIRYMLWFHRCGKEEKQGNGCSRAKAKRGYCFKQDAPLIYAAFLQQYHIDLRRTPNNDLHWWEFSALFECLDENVKMARVMYWRTCDLGSLSKMEKKFVKKMRTVYMLEEPDGNMDVRTRLTKRNADMKEYVRRRIADRRQVTLR